MSACLGSIVTAIFNALPNALKISFGGGTVMGLGVAGLAVLGLTAFFLIFFHYFMGGVWTNTNDMTVVLETLAGFSLGAESIALFARVGGGIYTKAADVGALLQCFQNFMKWSSRLFDEMYLAYRSGRCSNPADGWYENQITFFDSYIAQLATRLKETGVFGECSDLFTIQVQRNRARWITEGIKLTAELTENAQNRYEERFILHKRASRMTL